MKKNYNEIKELLIQNSFKKKAEDCFYLITPIVLKESEDFLAVVVRFEGDCIYICDEGQLLDSYDYPNLDIIAIRNKVLKNIKDVSFKGLNLYKKSKELAVLQGISDFIKTIILIETEIEKEIYKNN